MTQITEQTRQLVFVVGKSEIATPLQSPLDRIRAGLQRDPHLSIKTRLAYYSDLSQFVPWLVGRQLTKGVCEEYLADMQQHGKTASTINRHLSAIRWLARWLVDRAIDEQRPDREEIESQAARICDIRSVNGPRSRLGRLITQEEFDALIETCRHDDYKTTGIRDRAILWTLRETGMRRFELAALLVSDFSLEGNHATLNVRNGKGGKSRLCHVVKAIPFLLDWLAARGDVPGPLFLRINRGGKIGTGGVHPNNLGAMLKKRIKLAGLKHMGLHDFRRTLGTAVIEKRGIAIAAKVLGHSNITTTQLYDLSGETEKLAAIQNLFA